MAQFQQHTEEDTKVKFRIRPPGYTYSKIKWVLPVMLETLAGIVVITLPVLVGSIIDHYSAGRSDQAQQAIYGVIAVVIFLAFNEFLGWRLTIKLMVEIERDWRAYTASLISRLTNTADAGQLIAIINKDSRSISSLIQNLPMSFGAVGVAVVGAIQLFSISPAVAIIALTGITLTITVLTHASKYLEKKADERRERIGTNATAASDIATSLRTIAGLGAQQTMMSRYRTSAYKLRNSHLAYSRLETWLSASRVTLIGFTTLFSVGYALRGSLQGSQWVTDIPTGQLVAVSGVIAMMVGPVWVVEMFLYSWRSARVALKRINDLEAQAVEPAENGAADNCPTVHPFESRHRIVYLDPRSEGMSAQDYSEALAQQLRTQATAEGDTEARVLLSEPNPMIFAGTLAEHLQLGTKGLSQEEMIQLLQLTDSLEIAYRLGGNNPEDYLAAEIASEGSNLSGGQRQRLALARALAQDTHTLILAEPLNSVDEPSQKYIYTALEKNIKSHPQLAGLTKLYIVSTTVEVEKRIARDYAAEPHGIPVHLRDYFANTGQRQTGLPADSKNLDSSVEEDTRG